MNGKRYSTFGLMSEAIRKLPGQDVEIGVVRDGTREVVRATLARRHPQTTSASATSASARSTTTSGAASGEGVVEGVKEMGTVAKESVAGLGRLFSPSGVSKYLDNFTTKPAKEGEGSSAVPVDRPSSVVGIVQVGSQAAEAGFVNVLYLLFAVNMFIGIFNLTPLLPFDGGHVVIATYERIRSAISGRRYQADVSKLLPLTYAVVMVLALLFITTIYLDIANPLDIG